MKVIAIHRIHTVDADGEKVVHEPGSTFDLRKEDEWMLDPTVGAVRKTEADVAKAGKRGKAEPEPTPAPAGGDPDDMVG